MTKAMDEERLAGFDCCEIQGKTVWVPRPARIESAGEVVREEVAEKALAAWFPIEGPPQHFRLYGPSGVGKNTAIYSLSRMVERDLYIMLGHHGLTSEDVVCTPVMDSGQKVVYVASNLFAAAYRGGICFFDEIAKTQSGALDVLSAVLDARRELVSVSAGIRFRVHEDFLFCAALQQEEEECTGLPVFLDSRTRPAIHVGYPDRRTLERILRSQLSPACNAMIAAFLAMFRNSDIVPGTAVRLLRYAASLASRQGHRELTGEDAARYLRLACPDMKIKPDQADPATETIKGGSDEDRQNAARMAAGGKVQ